MQLSMPQYDETYRSFPLVRMTAKSKHVILTEGKDLYAASTDVIEAGAFGARSLFPLFRVLMPFSLRAHRFRAR